MLSSVASGQPAMLRAMTEARTRNFIFFFLVILGKNDLRAVKCTFYTDTAGFQMIVQMIFRYLFFKKTITKIS